MYLKTILLKFLQVTFVNYDFVIENSYDFSMGIIFTVYKFWLIIKIKL